MSLVEERPKSNVAQIVSASAAVAAVVLAVAVSRCSTTGTGGPTTAPAARATLTTSGPTETSSTTVDEPTTSAVASAGAAVLGFDMGDIDDQSCGRSWVTEPAKLNGTAFAQTLTCEGVIGRTGWLDFDLSRAYSRFTATVGLDDASNAGAQATFEVLDDVGNQLAVVDLGLGQTEVIDVDVSGILHLRLQATAIDGTEVIMAFANPTVGDEGLTATAGQKVAPPSSGRSVLGFDMGDIDDQSCGRSWVTEPAKLNGTAFAQTLTCEGVIGRTGWLDFDLSRAYSRFTATVGLDDASNAGAQATFEVLDDVGNQLAVVDLGLGQTEVIDVDVSGILHLRLQATAIDGTEVIMAFANPTVGDEGLTATAGQKVAPPSSGRSVLGFDMGDIDDQSCGRSWVTEPAKLNGTAFAQTLTCEGVIGRTGWLDFDLSRAYSRFTATVGLDDASNAGAQATFEVLDDVGNQLAVVDLGLGQTEVIDVDVSGILHLRLQATAIDGTEVIMAFANPTLWSGS